MEISASWGRFTTTLRQRNQTTNNKSDTIRGIIIMITTTSTWIDSLSSCHQGLTVSLLVSLNRPPIRHRNHTQFHWKAPQGKRGGHIIHSPPPTTKRRRFVYSSWSDSPCGHTLLLFHSYSTTLCHYDMTGYSSSRTSFPHCDTHFNPVILLPLWWITLWELVTKEEVQETRG